MLRNMAPADLEGVESLLRSIPGMWHECWNTNTLKTALSKSAELAFVNENDEKITGCIFGYNLGFRGYIASLAVAPEKQGKGIGKELVQRVESTLRARGCELIISDIAKGAEGFYTNMGWEPPHATLLRKLL